MRRFVFFPILILSILILGCDRFNDPYRNGTLSSDPPEDNNNPPMVSEVVPPKDGEDDPPEPDKVLPPEDGENDPPEPNKVLPPEDEEFQIGDAVIIQNVNNILENGNLHGLHIRGEPKLKEIYIWGHVFDGALGIIREGPIHDGGYVWWRILWVNDPALEWLPKYEELCTTTVCAVWSVQFLDNGQMTVLVKK